MKAAAKTSKVLYIPKPSIFICHAVEKALKAAQIELVNQKPQKTVLVNNMLK